MNLISIYDNKLENYKNKPYKELQDFLLEKVKEKHIVYKIFNNIYDLCKIEYIEYCKNPQKKISEMTLREFQNKIDFRYIPKYQILSEDFIREFHYRINWICLNNNMIPNKGYSYDFIRDFQNKVDWFLICEYQYLSEDFIREFQSNINWYIISKYQRLTEKFIREFKNYVDWERIIKYQILSKNFINEFHNYF
jgi:hypothetical protein